MGNNKQWSMFLQIKVKKKKIKINLILQKIEH